MRARLLAAFMALVAVTAGAVAGGMYVQARTEILQKSQDSAVQTMLTALQNMLPLRTLPPTQTELVELFDALSSRSSQAAVGYQDRWAGDLDKAALPPELTGAVRSGQVAWQRITEAGVPILIIGTRIGQSQLEAYTARNLLQERSSIDGLASRAWLTAACALAVAMLLGLVAASGVLGPIRELRRAAVNLGAGDLTARITVRGTDELAEVATTFNNTAEALQTQVGDLRRMEAEARRFVADVSHELRTPLAAMTAVADVLDEEAAVLTPDAAEAARLVSQETRNLTRLVNDLIEITKFDSGNAALVMDELDVGAAIQATLNSRGWSTEVAQHLQPGVTARLDPRRLDVIVANLVGNALTHGAKPVAVNLAANEYWLTIEVRDEGPGLPPAVLSHVFDRFYKASAARSRSAGSGLGLAIARENALLHGGTLKAGNGQKGAIFTLMLPKGKAQ